MVYPPPSFLRSVTGIRLLSIRPACLLLHAVTLTPFPITVLTPAKLTRRTEFQKYTLPAIAIVRLTR